MLFKQISKQNSNLKYAIIISIIMHVTIFTLLVWSSFNKNTKVLTNIVSDTNTVMIDNSNIIESNPNIIEQSYNKEQKSSEGSSKEQRVEYIRQEYSKKNKKEQLKIQENLQELEKKQKQNKETVIKKIKDDIEKTAINIKKVEPKTDVDSLFRELSSDKSKIKIDKIKENKYSSKNEVNNIINSNLSNMDINNYSEQIKIAIENKFYEPELYAGKVCILRIKLAQDGKLLDIRSEKGDNKLCNIALSAARRAQIPKPPSQAIYELFKNTVLEFKP